MNQIILTSFEQRYILAGEVSACHLKYTAITITNTVYISMKVGII